MPVVHWCRAKGFAGSLAQFGAKLKVAGPTFAPVVGHHAPCTTERAIAEIGPNVSAYEGSEIFDDPPDIIICGATSIESEIHALFARLNDIHPVALCAYSGNHYSRFGWSRYDGAICTDRATHAAARHNRVPSILFRPAFSLEDLPYREQPQTERLILRSYSTRGNAFAWHFYRRTIQAVLTQLPRVLRMSVIRLATLVNYTLGCGGRAI